MTYTEVRQCKKNEALNKIIFTYSKYFEYYQSMGWDDHADTQVEQRDQEVKMILSNLEYELNKLKNGKN